MSLLAPPVATSFLSDRINTMQESQTIGMAKKARALAAQGHDVINLSFGEPDFQTPQYIKDAAKRALDEGFTFYTPVPGYLELRQAICDKFKRDNNLDYQPNQIVVSTGAKQSLANAVLSLINPGDEVIVFAPYWVSYEEMVKLAEGVPVALVGTLENDYKVTAAELEGRYHAAHQAGYVLLALQPHGQRFLPRRARRHRRGAGPPPAHFRAGRRDL